jgi:hypothetical protein
VQDDAHIYSLCIITYHRHRRPLNGEDDDRIDRFVTTARQLHWWTVAMGATALLIGVGIGIVVVPVFGNTTAILRAAKALLVFDWADTAFVVSTLRHSSHRSHIRGESSSSG